MDHDPFDLSPQIETTGIRGAINTCYMNCITQCLCHTVEFSTIAFSDTHLCKAPYVELCDVCYFRSLMLIPFGSKINPSGLLKKLIPQLFEGHDLQMDRTFFKKFTPRKQEDAHEFFEAFLDFVKNLGCVAYSVFEGYLAPSIPCRDCHSRAKENPWFRVIHLNIGVEKRPEAALESARRLEELLENYFRNEINTKCLRHKDVVIKADSKIHKLPQVIVFHLNWFVKVYGTFQKSNDRFEYPLELDFRPFLFEEKSGNGKYKLYAFVEHLGEKMDSGHYVCFVRFEENVWFKFDDLEVTRVEEGVILSSKPYILFYNSENAPWFSQYYRKQAPVFDQYVTGLKSIPDLQWSNDSSSSSESGGSNKGIEKSGGSSESDSSTCSNEGIEESPRIEEARYVGLLYANEKLDSCYRERMRFVSDLAGNDKWLKRAARRAPECAAVDKENLVKIQFLQKTQPLFDYLSMKMKSKGKKKKHNKPFSSLETKVLIEAVKVHGKLWSKIVNSCYVLSSRDNTSLINRWRFLVTKALPAENPKGGTISDGMALAVLEVEVKHCSSKERGAILERIDQLKKRIQNSRKRQQGKSKVVGSE